MEFVVIAVVLLLYWAIRSIVVACLRQRKASKGREQHAMKNP